jgi:hypothetical protein
MGGKAFRNNSEDKEVSQHQLGGESNMRFYSTALIIIAMATMLLALTLLTTTSLYGSRTIGSTIYRIVGKMTLDGEGPHTAHGTIDRNSLR